MPGFDNNVMFAGNVDFRGVEPIAAQVTTDGQLLIGATAAPHIRSGNLTSTGGTVTITPGAGTINLEVGGGVPTTFTENSGSASPVANILNVVGGTSTGGVATNINTIGTPGTNTVAICLNNNISQPNTNAAGTAGIYSLGGSRFIHNYDGDNIFIGLDAGNFTNTADNLTGIGTRVLGSATTCTNSIGIGYEALQNLHSGIANTCIGVWSGRALISAVGNVGLGNATLSLETTGQNNVAVGHDCMSFAINGCGNNTALGRWALARATGSQSNSCVGAYALTNLLGGNYNNGFGRSAGSNYVGAESSNIVISNSGVAGESNKIRIGTQGAGNGQQNACYIAGIASVVVPTNNLVTIDTTTGQLGSVAQTNGQLMIGSTGTSPVAATLTAGNNISITNAAGSITIAATTANSGIAWETIGASGNLVVGKGYMCNAGAALSFALPAVAAVGTEVALSLDGATSWTITQAANQRIRIGSAETTLGAGGSLASTAQGDTVRLVCVTANLRWIVVSSMGNITVV